jgi:hypothetical protein
MATTSTTQNTNTKSKSLKEQYDKTWNIIFGIMLVVAVIGTCFIAGEIKELSATLRATNPDYNWSSFSDMKWCIPMFICIILLKLTLEPALVHFTKKIMAKEYRNTNDPEKYQEGIKVSKKLANHIFKGSYYLFITIFGYYILDQTNFFPRSLLGHGSLSNLFLPGYPQSFFFYKPKYFDTYYLICFSYTCADFIYLIFFYERQTDFINMLLHHVCTMSLILFSFCTNYTHVGSIILFLHNETDIFVHLTRFLIRTDCPEKIKDITGILLVINFIWVRLFVLGQIIYTIVKYITWDWGYIVSFSLSFLCFLYIMHLNWTLKLLEKVYQLACGKQLSDTDGFKKNEVKKES